MFLSFKLSELFLVFRELIDHSLNDYIEKSITALTSSSLTSTLQDANVVFGCEVIDTIEAYSCLISPFG